MSNLSSLSNLAPLAPESSAQQAAGLIRYCMAIMGLDRPSFAAWLRRIAADLEAEEAKH